MAIRPLKVRFIPPHVHLAARKCHCGAMPEPGVIPALARLRGLALPLPQPIVKWDETASVFDAQEQGPRASGCDSWTRPLSRIRGDDSPTERRSERCDCRPTS